MEDPSEKYDIIVCYSLTKWIHLNYGDAGVVKLFDKIKSWLSPRGLLILEIQKFKSYSKKLRDFPLFKHTYNQIVLQPDQFSDYLTNKLGFVAEKVVASLNTESFKRDISLFRLLN